MRHMFFGIFCLLMTSCKVQEASSLVSETNQPETDPSPSSHLSEDHGYTTTPEFTYQTTEVSPAEPDDEDAPTSSKDQKEQELKKIGQEYIITALPPNQKQLKIKPDSQKIISAKSPGGDGHDHMFYFESTDGYVHSVNISDPDSAPATAVPGSYSSWHKGRKITSADLQSIAPKGWVSGSHDITIEDLNSVAPDWLKEP